MSKKMRMLQILNLWRLIPAYLIVCASNNKSIIFEEIQHWKKCTGRTEKAGFDIFSSLMLELKEYRTLLQYRLGGYSKLLLKMLFPGMDTLYINTPEIGPRLFIQHGFATNISAKRIGSDCWINQQVTIGYTFDSEPPVIGNGVRISAGAKVLGQIEIGDNAIIGANAAVVKSVEENMIVGGVPAKIIGENSKHKLFIGEKQSSLYNDYEVRK
ncbi:serine O-acetyltransferase [Lachnospiraceae bacterium SGI.066]